MYLFFFNCFLGLRDLHSFPTRRSSDLSASASSRCSPREPNARVSVPSSSMARSSRCGPTSVRRSEEHTSELQSPYDLVCRLLLEKKKLSLFAHLACSTQWL